MALTVVLTATGAYNAAGAEPSPVQIAVTNTSASSVTLTQLATNEVTKSGLTVAQPLFLTPNVPLGTGNPTILAGATAYYMFNVSAPSPNTPGPSPNQASLAGGLGSSGMMNGQPANSVFVVQAIAQASDGSIGTAQLTLACVPATPVFPQSLGGSMQFNNPFNAINLL